MVLTHTTTYPLILPLAQAAEALGVTEDKLRFMIQSGKMRAFVDPEGNMYVQMPLPLEAQTDEPEDINARLSQIRREDFAHLEGQPITVSEAARKYGVPVSTIHFWVQKGFISVLDWETGRGGSRKRLDEADMAYCAAIYKVREEEGVKGVPLLDEEGRPYLLRAPEIAQARRRSK